MIHSKTFINLIGLLFSLSLTSCIFYTPSSAGIHESDIIGTWQASYENIQDIDIQTSTLFSLFGSETLIIRSDGTYFQVYDDIINNLHLERESTWYFDTDKILHLKGGLWPQLGPSGLKMFIEEKMLIRILLQKKEYHLDGTEVLLLVLRDPRSNKIYLKHMQTGDPDSPHIITFSKVSPQ